MDRRGFVRIAVLAGLAGACAGDGSAPTTAPAPPTFDPVKQVAPGAAEVLSMISGSYEQLTGREVPLAFGLLDRENAPVKGADVTVWVVPVDGRTPAGPFPTTFHEVPGHPVGLYVSQVDIRVPGPTVFVAVTGDGRAGADAIQVATPETSVIPGPGRAALSVPTATFEDTRGQERVCTANPPCGMHESSLDAAMAQGRPVALMFATPLYCQTAVCGPSVAVLDQVRASREWGSVAFIHQEIYRDGGRTLSEPVQQWALPSEPWLFTIQGDGMVAARADGPLLTLPEVVERQVDQVAA